VNSDRQMVWSQVTEVELVMETGFWYAKD